VDEGGDGNSSERHLVRESCHERGVEVEQKLLADGGQSRKVAAEGHPPSMQPI